MAAGVENTKLTTPAWTYTLAQTLLKSGRRRLATLFSLSAFNQCPNERTAHQLAQAQLHLGLGATALRIYDSQLRPFKDAITVIGAWMTREIVAEVGTVFQRRRSNWRPPEVHDGLATDLVRQRAACEALAVDPLNVRATAEHATVLSQANSEVACLHWIRCVAAGVRTREILAATIADVGNLASKMESSEFDELELALIRLAVAVHGEAFLAFADNMMADQARPFSSRYASAAERFPDLQSTDSPSYIHAHMLVAQEQK